MLKAVLFSSSLALAATGFAATAPTATKAPAAPAVRATTARPALAPQAQAPAPVLPAMTAEQIVDRNVAARGGLAAWQSVSTLTLSGQMDAGGKPNVELPFALKLKRGHKSRLELTFRDQTAMQVYDGSQGWKVRPFLNRSEVEPYNAAEAKAAADFEELDGPLLDYAKKGTRVEVAGTESIEGEATYKLRLTSKGGVQRHIWIDAKSFLERRMDGEPKKMDGRLRSVSVYFRDYKTENGLTTPRVLETKYDGTTVSRKMTITKVEVNQPMQDALFQKPQLALAGGPAR